MLLSPDGRAAETRESSYKTIIFLITKALSLFLPYLSHFIKHVYDIVADNFITCIISPRSRIAEPHLHSPTVSTSANGVISFK
jgi:hypothetical protein